jgi:hypothetical protein
MSQVLEAELRHSLTLVSGLPDILLGVVESSRGLGFAETQAAPLITAQKTSKLIIAITWSLVEQSIANSKAVSALRGTQHNI